MGRHRAAVTVATAITIGAAVLIAGCGSGAGSGNALSGEITVSAAASLTEAFEEIERRFVAEHPDAKIVFDFGSSPQLATQIERGAPVDVVALAGTTPMDSLEAAGHVEKPHVFAHSDLVIVTEPDNPHDIKSLRNLATVGTISLCAPSAPCGQYAQEVLDLAGLTLPENTITRGRDVRTALIAVSDGDAVAGIVYSADATIVGSRVDTVEIPAPENVVADYPIATVLDSGNRELAAGFVEYVTGATGREILADHGFSTGR